MCNVQHISVRSTIKNNALIYLSLFRLNKEILSKKNEVKLLSEKLVNRKQDFTVSIYTSIHTICLTSFMYQVRRIKKHLAPKK